LPAVSTLVFDYGIARPQRLMHALAVAGVDARISSAAQDLRTADRVILPDGADDDGSLARGIPDRALAALHAHLDTGRPLLAIGLGVQLLLSGKAHANMPPGLGVFATPVARFDPRMADDTERPLKTPHVGYSYVVGLDRHPVLGRLVPEEEQGVWLYFRHRLLAPARVPFAEVAVAHHGVPFAGAIWRENVLALQFLPELSGAVGLEVLRAWGEGAR
jgi:glutamine amidotransferase